MTESDYQKFLKLFVRYTHRSVSYTTEYHNWRKDNHRNNEHSEILKSKGDSLDRAGNELRTFIKGFVK